MALSGSTDFTLSAAKVVEKAFSLLGVKAAEQPLTASEREDGQEALNIMLKYWVANGYHLWTKTQGVLFTQTGKTDYLLGATGDHACLYDDFVATTTTSAIISGSAVIPVTSSTGMSASDYVGIKLSDGTRQWSTIASVDSSTQITLDDNLTGAASTGTSVFTYTSIVERPLRILNARRKLYGFDDEIMCVELSNDDYFNMSLKSSQGTITSYYYQPVLGNGRMYLWQTSDNVDQLVYFTFCRTIQDIDEQSNNLDVPVEWLDAVTYNLAARLADDYNAPANKVETVLFKAGAFLKTLKEWDVNNTSVQIVPSYGDY
jgi:hypothetical protein